MMSIVAAFDHPVAETVMALTKYSNKCQVENIMCYTPVYFYCLVCVNIMFEMA
jgi:hypothetical protein